MNFEILDIDALGRIGKIELNGKQMITPNLFPVVHPYKNVIPPSIISKIGAECIFTNAYIIFQNDKLKNDVIEKGIHDYLNFNGFIATDSGAYQQYIYKNKDFYINPEEIEIFQEKIGSDFPVILDLPVQLNDDYKTAKKKVITTIKRAKENIKRRKNKNCLWFGPIHGAQYHDLLTFCTYEMNKLDYRIMAIGGLVESFLKYDFTFAIKNLLIVKKIINQHKLIHMFGLGLPQFFSLAVACGCDLMDSAAYILYAKGNRYFTLTTGTEKLEDLEEFPCHCPICCEYSPIDLKKTNSVHRIELLAKHNLYISFSELKTIRQAIRGGKLWELVEQRIRMHPNLVKAAKKLKDNVDFIEKFEKIYKKHGSLYISPESIYRPSIFRYQERLKTKYRVPNEADFLLILPEPENKEQKNSILKIWLDQIINNNKISREQIHITFFSEIYGIIPLELINSFPMGQYESINISIKNDILYSNALEELNIFFKTHMHRYKKCAILIPKKLISQCQNEFKVSINIMEKIFLELKSNYPKFILIYNNLNELLQYIKENQKKWR
ncbi:MAG: tRNA guanosine(15) transglycosylase TgtA [Promethearchaeota archaeon]